MLELHYTHPQSSAPVQMRQTVRVPRDQPFEMRIGERAELLCWGIMPSGLLRHPLWLRWTI